MVAWTRDLRSSVHSELCRKNRGVWPFSALGGGRGHRHGEQLVNAGVNLNVFAESWKDLASSILFDHC